MPVSKISHTVKLIGILLLVNFVMTARFVWSGLPREFLPQYEWLTILIAVALILSWLPLLPAGLHLLRLNSAGIKWLTLAVIAQFLGATFFVLPVVGYIVPFQGTFTYEVIIYCFNILVLLSVFLLMRRLKSLHNQSRDTGATK